jgi:spermidine/putrescine transport system permease protein
MRRSGWVVDLLAIGVFGMLYLPLLCVVLFSVNASRLGLSWGGFTLSWYTKLLENELIISAASNTLVLALSSTAISTVLGTLLAIGIQRLPWGKKMNASLEGLLNLPVVTPDIIFAVALVIAFGALRSITGLFELGMPTMVIGHVAFQVAFVALIIRSRLQAIAVEYEEAAFDLYASYGRMLWTVILPLLRPAILAGAALAFTLSLDDFVISFFTAGPDSITLPIYIYAAVHRGVTPEIHALSTLVMVLTILVVSLMQWLTAKSEQESA